MKELRWNEAAGGASGLSAQALTCAESGPLLPLGLEEIDESPERRGHVAAAVVVEIGAVE